MTWPGPTAVAVATVPDFVTWTSGVVTLLNTVAVLFVVSRSFANVVEVEFVIVAGSPVDATSAVTVYVSFGGVPVEAGKFTVPEIAPVPGVDGQTTPPTAVHVQLHEAMPVGIESVYVTPGAAPGPLFV